jgi:hypothetical protein
MKYACLKYLLVLVLMVFMVTLDAERIDASSSVSLRQHSSYSKTKALAGQFNDWSHDNEIQGALREPVRVIVRLRKGQMDVIRSTARKDSKSRKLSVYRHLKRLNQKSLSRLAEKLGRQRIKGRHLPRWQTRLRRPPKSLWLANALAMTVDSRDIETLLQDPEVAEVAPNTILSIPPISSRKTASEDYSSEGPPDMWNHDLIDLDYVHQRGYDGTGMRIGVLDTGIDADHPELNDKLVAWQEFDLAGNRVLSTPHETHTLAHGTHVASILVGEQTGIAPRAKLLCALVLPEGYGTTEQVIRGMQWVLDPDGDSETDDGAQVVNMSWGSSGTSAVLKSAIDAMAAAGVLAVAAIGNDGRDSTYSPGNVEACIGVGAVNRWDNPSSYSSGGEVCWDELCIKKPDMVAPGIDIFGAATGGRYQYLSGTSMASPHAAGSAALLWQYDPTMTLSQLTRFLTHSAADFGPYGMDTRYGWGRLNAWSPIAFRDLYEDRIGAADLILQKVKNSSKGITQYYITYFSDGQSTFLEDEFDSMQVVSSSDDIEKAVLGFGDVDGDGYADLLNRVVSPLESDLFRVEYMVYPSRGAYGFSDKRQGWHAFETDDPHADQLAGIGDFNGDGKADLAFYQTIPSGDDKGIQIFVMISEGTGFQDPAGGSWLHIDTSSKFKYELGVGDVNADGMADVIVTKNYKNYRFYHKSYAYAALSDGQKFQPLTKWLTQPPVSPYGFIEDYFYADVNGDNAADLLYMDQVIDMQEEDKRRLHVCLSNGDDKFFPSTIWAEIDGDLMPAIADLKDVNSDGAADAIILYTDSVSNSKRLCVRVSEWTNNTFGICEDSWFNDPNSIISSQSVNVVGVANVGLGTW